MNKNLPVPIPARGSSSSAGLLVLVACGTWSVLGRGDNGIVEWEVGREVGRELRGTVGREVGRAVGGAVGRVVLVPRIGSRPEKVDDMVSLLEEGGIVL